jgi:hypothetical protein
MEKTEDDEIKFLAQGTYGLTYELKGKERKISSAATSNIKKYLFGDFVVSEETSNY